MGDADDGPGRETCSMHVMHLRQQNASSRALSDETVERKAIQYKNST